MGQSYVMGFNSSGNSVINVEIRSAKSAVPFRAQLRGRNRYGVLRRWQLGIIYPLRKRFQGNQRQILFPLRLALR